MAYMNADTLPKVGFRPHGQTDPFNAAHLSGVFDPWKLHFSGLGRNPFHELTWTLGGLGDVNDTAQGMIQEGYDRGIISSLVAIGATETQLQTLWDNFAPNTTDFSDAAQSLMMQLSGLGTAPITGSSMQTSTAGAAYGAVAPAPAPTSKNVATITPQVAGVPAGTQLLYTVTWARQLLTTQTPQDIENVVASALASKHAITVVQASATSNFFVNQPTFTIQVVTHIDYGKVDDIKSIIDGEVYNAGRTPVSSSISVIKNVDGSAVQSAMPSQFGQWIQDNFLWIGLGAFALLYVTPPGRRR